MTNNIIDALKIIGIIEENVSFKHLTTYRVGGNARIVFYPYNVDNLIKAISLLKKENINYKIFGNGSNILCSDEDYDGVIIKLNRTLNSFEFNDNVLYCEAGCSIITLATQAARKGLSGLEFACGIPGTLGGCIFMNAGAYKAEMKDIIIDVIALINDKLITINLDQCDFSYRSSYFKKNPDIVVLGAHLLLKYEDKEKIMEIMDSRRKKRIESQPLNYPSAGSVFRNPDGLLAWNLIDEIGYRGVSYGDAYVSEKHTNFIVNREEATGTQINELITDIQKKVYDKFNVQLVCEVERFNWKK